MASLLDAAEILSLDEPERELWTRAHGSAPYQKKDAKLKANRFLGPLQRMENELPNVALHELCYTMTGLECDLFHGKKFELAFNKPISGAAESSSGGMGALIQR